MVVLPFFIHRTIVESIEVGASCGNHTFWDIRIIREREGQQFVVVFGTSVGGDIFLHRDFEVIGIMLQLAAVSDGDGAAIDSDLFGNGSITSRDGGIGFDDHIAACLRHCAARPIAVIVPIAIGNEDVAAQSGEEVHSSPYSSVARALDLISVCSAHLQASNGDGVLGGAERGPVLLGRSFNDKVINTD